VVDATKPPTTPRRRIVLDIAFAAACAAALGACGRSDPERELRDTVQRMAQAIESREVGEFLDHVAEDFTRESGGFGKQDARRILAAVLLRNEKITVSAVVSEVKVDGERATVKVRVLATGGAGWLPERGQTWDFDSAWRREGGVWKVYNAQWREGL
jgi:hypothetical protein